MLGAGAGSGAGPGSWGIASTSSSNAGSSSRSTAGTTLGPQRDADNLLDAEPTVNGYVRIRVSSRRVEREWPEVQRLSMAALSQVRPSHGRHG
ncbi:hypothetical protein FM113_01755 [Leucobacter sp. 7(1)]|nr:hypothetical protein FM113_01755 [Leucobacter sp. 7(1)]